MLYLLIHVLGIVVCKIEAQPSYLNGLTFPPAGGNLVTKEVFDSYKVGDRLQIGKE